MAQPKTNAMRMLEKEKVAYTFHEYPHDDGAIDGLAVAGKLGQDPARVFKTLVTQGASRAFYVFVIPVAAELDLKKGRPGGGGKERGHAARGGSFKDHRLHPGRVQPGGHEKALCDGGGRLGRKLAHHYGERGANRRAGGAAARRPFGGDGRSLGRACDAVKFCTGSMTNRLFNW